MNKQFKTLLKAFNEALRREELAQRQLTWGEERDGLQAAVLGRVHLQPRQLVHLLLEHAHLVHEGHDALGRHGRRVEARRRQQGRHVEREGRLGRVQDEQLAPAETQQRHLGDHRDRTGGEEEATTHDLLKYYVLLHYIIEPTPSMVDKIVK